MCVFDKNLVSQCHCSTSDEPCTPPLFMAFARRGLDVRGLPLHRRPYLLESTERRRTIAIYPARLSGRENRGQ